VGLTPTEAGELVSFIKTNPLVTDPEKLNQLRTFEQTFRQKLLESTGNDFNAYTKMLSDPQIVRQMEEARRALMYGHSNAETNYISAQDRVLDADTWDQLQFYINDKVDNSAGLSATRLVSEISDFFRDPRVTNLSDEDLAKVIPPAVLESINWANPAVMQSVANIAGDKVAYNIARYGVAEVARLPAQVVGKILRVAGDTAVGRAGSEMTKWGAKKGTSLAATKAGAKFAGPIGWAAAAGMDAFMFHQAAGRDMGQIKDAFGVIKASQAALQSSAVRGQMPEQMQEIMGALQEAVSTVNTISERHGINVRLDLNNIVSRQVASRLQTQQVIDTAAAAAYGGGMQQGPPQQQPSGAAPGRGGGGGYERFKAVPQ
jgi:hypothetical protein